MVTLNYGVDFFSSSKNTNCVPTLIVCTLIIIFSDHPELCDPRLVLEK